MPATTIETPRLLLRGWIDEDLEHWMAMHEDPRVVEFFPVTTRERLLAQAARMRERLVIDGYGWWVAQLKATGEFAGVFPLQEVPFQAKFTPAYEIGWRLPVEMWGNGYATEGAQAIIGFARDRLGLHQVVAMTAVLNERSQRVMQRLGMTRDPRDDFDHPRIEPGNPLRPHVLYRLRLR